MKKNTLYCPLCDYLFEVLLSDLEDDPYAGDCPLCGNQNTDTRYHVEN